MFMGRFGPVLLEYLKSFARRWATNGCGTSRGPLDLTASWFTTWFHKETERLRSGAGHPGVAGIRGWLGGWRGCSAGS